MQQGVGFPAAMVDGSPFGAGSLRSTDTTGASARNSCRLGGLRRLGTAAPIIVETSWAGLGKGPTAPPGDGSTLEEPFWVVQHTIELASAANANMAA